MYILTVHNYILSTLFAFMYMQLHTQTHYTWTRSTSSNFGIQHAIESVIAESPLNLLLLVNGQMS